MSTHLQRGKVNVSLIQTAARNSLLNLLDKYQGPKALVWDNSLSGPVGLIAEYSVLKQHLVDKMYPLRATPLPDTDVAHIIFIARPKLHLMDFVAMNIHAENRARRNASKQYHVFFVPKRSLLCEERLKQKGVFGSITSFEEFHCELMPFESDVVSMEVADVFREYVINNDPTYLYEAAQAILMIQRFYGNIPRVWGKGVAAKHVWDLVVRLQRERNTEEDVPLKQPCIDQMILIDRSVDLISPLASQLTYEGLIDQIFGIKDSTARFPIDHFLSSEERTSESLSEASKQIILNSADKLFADIRDKNFNAVGAYLSKQAKAISSQIENIQDKSVQEMKLYVQRLDQILKKKKALSHHTAIAECIKEVTDGYDFLDTLQTEQEFLNCINVDKCSSHIEDMIAQCKPLVEVLRLICLQCITASGIKLKILEHYKRELVQVYGIQALLAITNLEKAGLIKVQTSPRQYTVLRKALRLTMEDVSEIEPTDISYVHSVYAPLSIRLVEHVIKNGGFGQLQDVLDRLPGPTIDEGGQGSVLPNSEASQVIFVFFIGGCTFAEISALRFLSQQEDSNVDFVIGTTKLINSYTFLKSIIEQ